jgi:hypothetical protein
MAWTTAQLQAAIAALDVPDDSDAQIAGLLNAQTVVLSEQPFPWGQALLLARTAATGDWARIVARSRQTPALPPATPTDAAILAAINATESQPGDVIDPTDAATWAAFQAGLAALEASGDLSSATIAAIGALTTVTAAAWTPPIQPNDVFNARGGV